MSWKKRFQSKVVDAEEAAARIKNGDRVYVGSMCAEPGILTKALGETTLDDVEIVQLKAGAEASRLASRKGSGFRLKTFSALGRDEDYAGFSDSSYVPLFHSEIPRFFRSRRIPIDVALVQVTEPDRFGQVSLGISVDITRAAVECARTVIAQVNPLMPRTLGNTFVPAERFDCLVDGQEDLLEIGEVKFADADAKISQFCSELIDDGAVVHVGFAAFSHGFIEHLMDRKDLGVHTEMFTDSLMDLLEAGVVTNATKKTYCGKSIASFCMGTRRLYDYVNDNPLFEFHPSDTVLDPHLIASNERMVAITVALQVDLRGQIRQGSLGWTPFEGAGGEQDFMRGAGLSTGGRSIVCLRSTDRSGRSTIVPGFGPRAAVIMNRGDVPFVVTEFGVAYLGGKTIRQRAMALIEVAHPDHREDLMDQARKLEYVDSNQFYFQLATPEVRARVRTEQVFKGGLKARIRSIKSTDEGMLRDLFYQLSERDVYFRYFSPRRSMPHDNLFQYVNMAGQEGLSLVVTVGPRETRKMVAEGRYILGHDDPYPDVAFMVDENYQGLGIGSYLFNYLIELAQEQGYGGLRADVLASNAPMLKLFDRLPYETERSVSEGIISIRCHFDRPTIPEEQPGKQ